MLPHGCLPRTNNLTEMAYSFKIITILFIISNSIHLHAQSKIYLNHKPCSFQIDLPLDMKISRMYKEVSRDYCDYRVRLKDGFSVMELHSMLNSRFEFSSISEAYQSAVSSSKLNITYKMKSGNFFVISGYDPVNGNIVYWKRVLGDSYVSDMIIEYDRSRKGLIEKHIGRIAKSFRSE